MADEMHPAVEPEREVVDQSNATPPSGAITEASLAPTASRRLDVDVRSRDAFELLKLGEAIVQVKADLRVLRLEKEDLRFERDRYKAAATAYQAKLVQALDDLQEARSFSEDAESLRRDVVEIAVEFKERLAQDKRRLESQAEGDKERALQQLQITHRAATENHRALLAALEAEHANVLRNEIVALAGEFRDKMKDQDSKLVKRRWL